MPEEDLKLFPVTKLSATLNTVDANNENSPVTLSYTYFGKPYLIETTTNQLDERLATIHSVDLWGIETSDHTMIYKYRNRHGKTISCKEENDVDKVIAKDIPSAFMGFVIHDKSNTEATKIYVTKHYNWYWKIDNTQRYSDTAGLVEILEQSDISWQKTEVALGIGLGAVILGSVAWETYRPLSYLGSYDTPGHAEGIAINGDGTTAYVADNDSGLQIVDVTNPAAPSLLGIYDILDFAYSIAINGDGTTAYVLDVRLQIIDVTNPAEPSLLGDSFVLSSANGIAISGGTAYVVNNDGSLQIIDVTNPAAPSLLGSYDTSDLGQAVPHGVAVSGTTAYVAIPFGHAGLQIIDVTNPAAPSLLGRIDTPGLWCIAIDEAGTTAYVQTNNAGLQIIDVTNPASPRLGSYYPLFWRFGCGRCGFQDIAISDTTIYVANGFAGLLIFEVKNQFSPIGVSILTLSIGAAAIFITNHYINAKRLLNISNSMNLGETIKRLKANDPHTTDIDLSNQKLGDKDLTTLAKALTSNQALETLNLNYNQITSEGVKALAELVVVQSSLEEISLDGNPIEDTGAIALATALQNNTHLKTLHLMHCKIGDTGGEAFVSSVEQNQTLTELALNFNEIDGRIISKLNEHLARNKKSTLKSDEQAKKIYSNHNPSTLFSTAPARDDDMKSIPTDLRESGLGSFSIV